ncbi:hypothetical protein Fuma_04972 [Fuerstiella marisgermanici]|uniref:Uncharacterized protein n=1 Tax=Fuerstiella marisgermanici TaxID=1891926 RepID=A0A1P8WMN4_9PLAN|nr:hypothetical protein Fuma_04972 [Fuerstiella marisgermanici]
MSSPLILHIPPQFNRNPPIQLLKIAGPGRPGPRLGWSAGGMQSRSSAMLVLGGGRAGRVRELRHHFSRGSTRTDHEIYQWTRLWRCRSLQSLDQKPMLLNFQTVQRFRQTQHVGRRPWCRIRLMSIVRCAVVHSNSISNKNVRFRVRPQKNRTADEHRSTQIPDCELSVGIEFCS